MHVLIELVMLLLLLLLLLVGLLLLVAVRPLVAHLFETSRWLVEVIAVVLSE